MQRTRIWFSLFLASLLLNSCGGGYSGGGGAGGGGNGGGQAAERDALYLPTGASNGVILTFIFDSYAGTLTDSGIQTPGPPGGLDLKLDPAANFLYASDFDTNSVYGFRVDSATAKLTAVVGSPFPFPGTVPPNRGNGGPLTVDPAGKFVFYSDAFGSITSFVMIRPAAL